MTKASSMLSDAALSQLVFESQVTLRNLELSPDPVCQRVRKFTAFYHALREKPRGVALLYQGNGSTAIGYHEIGDQLVVGRLSKSEHNPAGCDLALRDAEMSRTHFQINFTDGLYVLRDLGSRNGTSINGNPRITREAILKAGDTIRAGNAIFVFTGV
jgi:hypothetical protein